MGARRQRARGIRADRHDNYASRARRWMHDAMKQHLYETAIFWGQQVVALERALVVWALY